MHEEGPPPGSGAQSPGYGGSPPPGYGPPPDAYPAPPGGRVTTDPFGRPLASWGRRALAAIIDWLILFVVSTVVNAVLFGAVVATDDAFDDGARTGWSVVGIVVPILYKALLEARPAGQTVGKMATGITVRSTETGQSLELGPALLRALVFNGLFALCFIPGVVNVLSPLWDPRRQAWHDKAARSVVIDVPR